MPRRFNTAGPNDLARHPTVSIFTRAPRVRDVIDSGASFVLHGPRQSGKTTALLELAAALNREGRYLAAVLSLEPGAAFQDLAAAELAMLDSWRYDLAAHLPADTKLPQWPEAPPGNRIGAALSAWAVSSERPLVVLLDGLDSLPRDVRASVVRQMRAGKPRAPRAFPWSVGLSSLRGPRLEDPAEPPASRAILDAESIELLPLTREDCVALVAELHAMLRVEVLPGAADRVFELTQGHPMLVCALAQRLAELGQSAGPIGSADVDRAKDALIEGRGGSVLDEVEAQIREPRIRAALTQIAAGSGREMASDDIRAVVDLGIVRRALDGRLYIANPFFLDMMARSMPGSMRSVFPPGQPPWIGAGGRLDRDKLLSEFLGFWKRHGEELFSTAPYSEISPLVLTAFLHRVVTSGGSIEREYALGRGRMDVYIRQGGDALALVVKVRRDPDPDPTLEGLAQLEQSLTRMGFETGWLIVFDRRVGLSPLSQRLAAVKEQTPGGREVVVIRA